MVTFSFIYVLSISTGMVWELTTHICCLLPRKTPSKKPSEVSKAAKNGSEGDFQDCCLLAKLPLVTF